MYAGATPLTAPSLIYSILQEVQIEAVQNFQWWCQQRCAWHPTPPPLPHSDCLLLRPSEEVGYDRKSWSGLLSFAITGRMQVDWTGGVLWSHLEKGRHSSWHNISAPPALSGLLEIQRSWTAQSMTSSYLVPPWYKFREIASSQSPVGKGSLLTTVTSSKVTGKNVYWEQHN